MTTCIRILILTAVLLIPASASADWFLFPFAAANAGGDSTRTSGAYGASLGWTWRWIGAEAEGAASPSFFDDDDGFRTRHGQSTYTATALAGPRLGAWRPYVAIGAGLVRSSIEEIGGLASVTDERGAVHIGGGAMWHPARHVGARADLRYIRALDDQEAEGNVFSERFAEFAYWRLGGGVTLRW